MPFRKHPVSGVVQHALLLAGANSKRGFLVGSFLSRHGPRQSFRPWRGHCLLQSIPVVVRAPRGPPTHRRARLKAASMLHTLP